MIHEGFTLGLAAWFASLLALSFGVVLGARALLDPRWAARLVRLQEDAQGGGFAEFRATYGGVFLGVHVVALYFAAQWVFNGAFVVGAHAAGAIACVAFGWFGAAFGRCVSMWRDRTRTRFNIVSALVETAMGLAIAAPWALWRISPAG